MATKKSSHHDQPSSSSAKKGSHSKASHEQKTHGRVEPSAATHRTSGSSRKESAGRSSDHGSKVTTDHDEIRRWAEARGGKPATVKRTEGAHGEPGVLRIDFPGYSGGGSLEEITWEQFFEKFEEAKLALVYQEETADGERSNFNKLVARDQK